MTLIFSCTRFEGFHHWPEAPDEVSFLRELHRHEFHVKAWREVSHEHRETEFILWKRDINKIIRAIQMTEDCTRWSCETWARKIGQRAGAYSVEVSEDGENGSLWQNGDHKQI